MSSELQPWTITIPKEVPDMTGTIQNGLISVTYGGGGGSGAVSTFSHRNPKADTLKVVKLTKDNIRDVTAHILKSGASKVEVVDGMWISHSHEDGWFAPTLHVGKWIVEEWDYAKDRLTFRPATQTEREKYDLR